MKRVICCVVACLGMVACGEGEGDDDDEGWSGGGAFVEPAPGSVASRGQALYASLCASCHGQSGGDLRGRTGIAGVVRRGTDGMPAFPHLSGAEIASIEDYLNGRGGGAGAGSAAPAGGGAGVEADEDDD